MIYRQLLITFWITPIKHNWRILDIHRALLLSMLCCPNYPNTTKKLLLVIVLIIQNVYFIYSSENLAFLAHLMAPPVVFKYNHPMLPRSMDAVNAVEVCLIKQAFAWNVFNQNLIFSRWQFFVWANEYFQFIHQFHRIGSVLADFTNCYHIQLETWNCSQRSRNFACVQRVEMCAEVLFTFYSGLAIYTLMNC